MITRLLTAGGFVLALGCCNECYECAQFSGAESYCSRDHTDDELIVLEDACLNAGGDWYLLE